MSRVLQFKPQLMSHQLPFVMNDVTPIQGVTAGYRAGKSYAGVIKLIRCATELFPGSEGVCISPIAGMNRRNIVPIFRRILPTTGLEYDDDRLSNENPDAIDIKVGKKISRIWLNASAESYHRLHGMSLAFGFLDEADLCHSADIAYNAFLALGNRLSEHPNAIQFAVSTPEGYQMMFRRFVDEAVEGKTKLYQWSMRDNFLLPKGYIESRLQNIPAHLHPAYINGEFCNIYTKTVYPEFDRVLNDTNVSLRDVGMHTPIHIGMDFNIGACAAVAIVLIDNRPYAVDELIDLADVPAMIAEIKKRYRNPIFVYPDASGKNRNATGSTTSMAMLKQSGFKVIVNAANPRVGDRVNSMNAMFCNALGERRFLVNTRMCPFLTKALEQQAWVNQEPDKSHGIDHILDGCGYVITKLFPLTGKATLRTYQ